MKMPRIFGSQPQVRFLLGWLLAVVWTSSLLGESRVTNVFNGTTFNFPDGYVLGTSGYFNVMLVTNAARVSVSNDVIVGLGSAAVSNRLVVTGVGSCLSNSVGVYGGSLNVGSTGAFNVLEVRARGSVVTESELGVGVVASSSNNTVLVTGTGSLSAVSIYLGMSGGGNQVMVTNGGQVSAMQLRMGTNTTASRNSVVITGDGSAWTNSFACIVGELSSGNQLTVAAGGWMASDRGNAVGNFASSQSNSVLVTGAGSLWSIGENLLIGNFGSANQLTVSNGGQVSVSLGSSVGVDEGSSNNVALVTGAGSIWTTGSGFVLGNGGSGNQATISAGGKIVSPVGSVGLDASASNNAVLVTGSGSVWTNSRALSVGVSGTSNRLMIIAGGMVVASNAWVGQTATATSNAAIVAGAGSLLSIFTDLVVGGEGSANRLVVSNGGRVATLAGHLLVGESGNGNQITLGDGGLVANDDGYLGYHLGTFGNSALVTGDGSVWTNRSDLYVGYRGAGSRLTVSNGGLVVARSGFVGAYASSSNNAVLVTDSGSRWSMDSELSVGRSGYGNQLTISNKGEVASLNGYLGYEPGSSNNSVTVVGKGATWMNHGALVVGCGGASNRLTVADEGLVVAEGATVGMESGAINNAIVVAAGTLYVTNASGSSVLDVRRGMLTISDGTVDADRLYATNGLNSDLLFNGGTLTSRGTVVNNGQNFLVGDTVGNSVFTANGGSHIFSNNVVVGSSATGNRMVVVAGAQVSDSIGYLGDLSAARSNSVLVAGAGSLWTNRSSLYVGDAGSLNTLAISNGGQVVNTYGYVGYASTASNNTVVVDGDGSIWNSDQNVFVGRAGSRNRLIVSAGGRAINDNGYLSGIAGSDSNSVLVTGAGSLWSNRFTLYVGDAGSLNTLAISNGGQVVSLTGYLGSGSGASNNTVGVDGAASLWMNLSTLYVGYSGSSNRLTLANGGALVSSNVYVGFQSTASDNSVVVNGGSLVATNGLGNGFLSVLRGSLVINGGSVEVDRLVATNATGDVQFDNGALILRGAVAGNGARMSLGAAGGEAVLRILGGTNRFEDGLELAGVAGATGTVWLTGGSLLVTNNNTYIGLSGIGAATVSNGTWNARDVTVGRNPASFGSVTLLGGTNVFSSYLSLGSLEESTGAVVLAGGSLATTNNATYVGNLGIGRFTVSNGTWLAREVLVGGSGGSSGAFLVAGGTTRLASSLLVGNAAGATGVLVVAGGELVTTNQGGVIGNSGIGQAAVSGGTWRTTSLLLGQSAGSTGLLTVAGGSMLVTGAAASSVVEVRHGTLLLEGGALAADFLLATNGAGRLQLDDGDLSLGGALVANGSTLALGAAGGQAALWLTGGTNRFVNGLLLGNVANSTGLVWLTGGKLVTTNDSYSVGVSGSGGMTISNGVWLARDVYAGFNAGSRGALSIVGGSNQFFSTFSAGYNAGATGVVLLTDGDLATTNGGTTLGVSGRGQMTVSGGTWRASSVLLGQNSGSTGTLSVAGGIVLVTNSSGSAELELRRGLLALNGGTMTLDRLLATNTAATVDFNGGILSSRGTVVSNGAAFAVGDGVANGVLNLLGGTHAFQGGVAVSPNATVSGWGSVVGVLANTGTVTTAGGELRLLGPVKGPGSWNAASGDTLSFVRGGTVAGFASTGATVRVEGSLTNTGAISNPNGLILVGPDGSNGLLNVTGGSVDGGTIVVRSSGTLKVAVTVDTMSSFVTNQGTFQPFADFFTLSGGFRNEAAFTGRNAQVVQVLNGFANTGTVVLDTNSMLRVSGFGGQPQSGQITLRNGAILQSLSLWTNSGTLSVAKGAMVAGGSLQNQSVIEGAGYVSAALGNRSGGTVRATNGTLTLGGIVTNFAGGTLAATPNAELALNNDLVNQGTVNPQGGSINLPYLTLTNVGTLSGFGTYRAGNIINGGLASFSGGLTDIEAGWQNLAWHTTRVTSASVRFFGAVSNLPGGIFKNTSGSFTFYDTFYNAGLYASDPATNVFSGDVVIGESGAISGGAGDVFQIGGDLTVLNSNGLDIAGATLSLGGGGHTLDLAGAPSIGTLSLESGASLTLLGADLYVGVLSAGTNQIWTSQTIFYDQGLNPGLGGQFLNLSGGGSLAPVPEPGAAVLLLAALALAAGFRRRLASQT